MLHRGVLPGRLERDRAVSRVLLLPLAVHHFNVPRILRVSRGDGLVHFDPLHRRVLLSLGDRWSNNKPVSRR